MQNQFISVVIVCFSLFFSTQNFAQDFIFKGKVKNAETQKPIPNANIYINGSTIKRVSSNKDGAFTVGLQKGSYQIIIKDLNFETLVDSLWLSSNQSIDYALQPQSNKLAEVVVTGSKNDRTNSNQMGVEQLSSVELDRIPVFLGEKDIIKTIQLKPGVVSAGEGVSGFYVRGGSIDQNLVLLDQMQIFNAAHLLGFFSVFNGDALNSVELYKGTQPSNFGGRLSSVLNIKGVETNLKQWSFKGGVGLIASRITANGPLVKEKSGIHISVRRTYADLFTKLSSNQEVKNAVLNFYDVNSNFRYHISPKDRVNVSFYTGRDNFGSNRGFGISWGNTNLGVHWTHWSKHSIRRSTSMVLNQYNYDIRIGASKEKINIHSKIGALNIQHVSQYDISPYQLMKVGFETTLSQIEPRKIINPFSELPSTATPPKRGLENALFIANEWRKIKNFDVNVGLRFSGFTVLGGANSGVQNTYSDDQITQSIDLSSRLFWKTYINIEPRLGVNYHFDKHNVVKIFYGKNTQNIHIISNLAASTPTDTYLMSSLNIKPQISDLLSAGYFHHFPNQKYEISLEGFYKRFKNQIDYLATVDINSENFNESSLKYGNGKAFGVEIYASKKAGKLTGWLSYTYARSMRQINGINDNRTYPAKQDRPHTIAIVGMYDLNRRFNISATWTFITGTPTNYPKGTYAFEGTTINLYGGRNQDRFPNYHRMDLSLNLKSKNFENKRFYSEWNLSIYNFYNRYNAYFIKYSKQNNQKPIFEQTSLFGMVPSITYNFKF